MVMNHSSKDETKFLIFLDIETNGIGDFRPTPTQTMTQISWMKVNIRGTTVLTKDYVVKGATKIKQNLQNAQTIESINEKGIDPKIVLQEFFEDVGENDFIISHNIDFDIGILLRTLEDKPPFNLYENAICTMKLTTGFCKISGNYGYKWPKLSELAKKLDICVDDKFFHDSLYDCQVLKQIFFELLNLEPFLVLGDCMGQSNNQNIANFLKSYHMKKSCMDQSYHQNIENESFHPEIVPIN